MEETIICLAEHLRTAIRTGAPLYNGGRVDDCLETYTEAAKVALQSSALIAESPQGEMIRKALSDVDETQDAKEGAWIMRWTFDAVLDSDDGSCKESKSTTTNESDEWQDGKTENKTLLEKALNLQDTAAILRSGVSYVDGQEVVFPASAAVECLRTVGLTATREAATERCNRLLQAGIIVAVDPDVGVFEDGTKLHRFATDQELHESMDAMAAQNSDEGKLMVKTIELTLEDRESQKRTLLKEHPSSRRLVRRSSVETIATGQSQAAALVSFLVKLEPFLAVEDRKFRLKKYPNCFVGREAVDAAVAAAKLSPSRTEATAKLQELLTIGLLHHVTREHGFEDDHLFYRITPAHEIQKELDALVNESDTEADWTLADHVKHATLVERYKHFGSTGLSVTEILNSFFGCEGPEGWDVVDLQLWRDTMKRWGFGRRVSDNY